MRRIILMCLTIAVTGTALHAQGATAIVQMANFRFTPSQIELKANTRLVLRLRNESGTAHSFSAPEFFAAAHVDAGSAALVRAGRIEVPAHQTVDVELVPVAGRYPLKCSHTFHSFFGMRGIIVVR